ncbi:MAG TPA: DUF1146 family protein [Haloplasmataceae bacterium]
MKIYLVLELCIYFALLPIVYKVVSSIEISKIFKKGHINEIRMFYVFVIIIITKFVGDFINMLMTYFRQLFL